MRLNTASINKLHIYVEDKAFFRHLLFQLLFPNPN
jgi:hypothetical protein